MVLDITQIGNPVLRENCQEVTVAELAKPEMQTFIDDLIETKRAANGAGIAAPTGRQTVANLRGGGQGQSEISVQTRNRVDNLRQP